jgi:hypothetical protein
MKKEILHYLRAKYFKIYFLKIFAGRIGPYAFGMGANNNVGAVYRERKQ